MGSLTTPDAVYASQLFRCGEGLPLWSPEHTKHGEVLVGDVGYMRHGAFYRLFNATKAADDPINKEYGVPNGNSYKPFTQSQYGLNRDLNAISPGPMCSKSLTKLIVGGGAGTHGVDASFHFKCTDDQGAFLLLKDAATREELHPSRRMENYMHRNFRSWQSFAVDDLDVDLQPEDIMFVRGWVKTTQWAVAAITHEGREARVSISGEIGSVADAHLSIHKSDEVSNYYAHRTGPSRILHRKRHKHHHSSDSGSVEPSERDDADQLDQCIFLHYYKLKRRRFLGFKKLEAAAEPRDPSGPHDDDDEFVVEEASAREKPFDPVDYVLDYILEHSEADVAIANDRDIISICKGKEIPDDIPAFLRSVQPTIEVNADKLGILSFEDLDAIAAQTEAQDAEQAVADEQVQNHPDPNTQPVPPPETDLVENLQRKLVVRHNVGGMLLGLGADAHRGSVCALAYSPNGLYVASGYEDSTIILWDPATGGRITELRGHTDTICALAFSPDSSLLASGSRDCSIILWNVVAGEKTVALNGHDGFIDTLAFSPDGKKLASGSVDFTVRIWDVERGEQQSLCKAHNALVMVVTFSPDGTQLASGSADCDTRVWDAETGMEISVLKGHQGVVYSVQFAPDGRRLATASDDGTSVVWHAKSGERLVIFREHSGPVWSTAFSSDGKRLLSVASDRTVKVCDSYSTEAILAIDGAEGMVNAAVFSDDGEFVAAGAEDHSVCVWNTRTGERISVLEGHTDNLVNLRFSPDNRRLASASDDSTVRIWNISVALPAAV